MNLKQVNLLICINIIITLPRLIEARSIKAPFRAIIESAHMLMCDPAPDTIVQSEALQFRWDVLTEIATVEGERTHCFGHMLVILLERIIYNLQPYVGGIFRQSSLIDDLRFWQGWSTASYIYHQRGSEVGSYKETLVECTRCVFQDVWDEMRRVEDVNQAKYQLDKALCHKQTHMNSGLNCLRAL